MKVRWQKIAPGVYQTDTGRFRVVKDTSGVWYLSFGTTTLHADSLREAKQLADDQIDSEATNA